MGWKELGYEPFKKTITIKQGIPDFEPYKITFPDPPPFEEFVNYGLKPEEQFFVREAIPDWVYAVHKLKREVQVEKVKSNQYMAEWIHSQFKKRENGIWIYIYGKPFFIPGKYWWYLNYYFQNTDSGVGLADFRYTDLQYFWIWCLLVLPDPNIYGIIEFTMRRQGKTARMCGETLEEITKTANAKAGLQSKTASDAKDTFQDFFVEPWRNLLFFFSPIFDNKTYPAKELNFRSSSKSGEDMDSSLLADSVSKELGSSIEVRATVQNAFDGKKLLRYDGDEFGKVEEMDVYEAWRIHKQCLRIGQKVVGKAKITTTVEMLSKYGMEPFFRIWDESDRAPEKQTKLLQTVSGLIPIFTPGFEAYIYDQYGFAIVDDCTKVQAEYRKKVLISENRQNYVDLGYHKLGGKAFLQIEADAELSIAAKQSFLRRYPPSISVARRNDGKNCHFIQHIHLIDERLEQLRYGAETEYIGNLQWENGIQDTKVEFKSCTHKDHRGKSMGINCDKCRWRFYYLPLQYANNVFRDERGFLRPGNKGKFLVTADTFKYDDTNSNRKSTGTSHGYMEFDLEVDGGKEPHEWVSDDFIYEYGARPSSKTLYCEDVLMSCVFLGCEAFPEINVPAVWDHFVARGYIKFLKFRKMMKKTETGWKMVESNTPGVTTLGDVIKDPMFSAAENYLDRNVMRCKAVRFLQDCRDVEYKALTKYDYFVSGAQNLYGRSMVVMKKPDQGKKVPYNVGNMMSLRIAGT